MDVNLVLLRKSGKRRAFPLPRGVSVIGRQQNCDFHVPLSTVSRRHCQLDHTEKTIKIRDLGSRNGISVNGKAVDECEIKAGDHIKVSSLKFVCQIDGQPIEIENCDIAKPAQVQEQTFSDEALGEESDNSSAIDNIDDLNSLLEDIGSAEDNF